MNIRYLVKVGMMGLICFLAVSGIAAVQPGPQEAKAMKIEQVLKEIRELVKHGGADAYIGEKVTILHHLLQVSDRAWEEMKTPEARVAGFLHDIGHLFPDVPNIFGEIDGKWVPVGKENHEETGAEKLKEWGFPPEIYEPVRLHVEAKRYLVAAARRDGKEYPLSKASEESLKAQGGPMSSAEMVAFEANPYHGLALALRRAEELGKDPEARSRSLDDAMDYIRDYLQQRW